MEKPLVSVVVLVYQHAKFVEQCIQSVLDQNTNFEYEIIIGEDNSIDGSREICQNFAEKYTEKIRLFLRDRGNVIKINNRPTGRYNWIESLKQCRGKYIAFCEGDDYWTDESKLQKQVDLLEKNPEAAGSYHNTKVVYEDTEMKSHPYRKQLPDRIEVEQTIAYLSPFHTTSFIFRKEFLPSLPDWIVEPVSGDLVLFYLVAKSGPLLKVDGTLSVYRRNQGGVSHQRRKNKAFYHYNRYQLWNVISEHDTYNESIKQRLIEMKKYHINSILETDHQLFKMSVQEQGKLATLKRLLS